MTKKNIKEYPATHSMWTAWFAVDLDGNVAIMECFGEGPSPRGYGVDYLVEDLVRKENVSFTPSQQKIIDVSGIQEHWDSTANFFGDIEGTAPLNLPLPFFFYYQNSDAYGMSERMHSPHDCDCVTIDQLSESAKANMYRLPVRFSEAEKIQLAEFIPCQYWDEMQLFVDGHSCSPARFSDGKTYLVFRDGTHSSIEIDEAFSEHEVHLKDKMNPWLKEYRVNGKRGYLKYGAQNKDLYIRFGDYPWGGKGILADESTIVEEID